MRKRPRHSKLMADINIAPFTDVILVLLVVFMVTTPMILRSSIKIALPQVSNNRQSLEIKDKDINVNITAVGEVFLENQKYDLRLDMDLFKFKLKSLLGRYSDPAIIISGDRSVKYDYVVDVIDAASKLGYKHLVLATEFKR